MKPHKKYLVLAGLSIYLSVSTGIAFASSSTFLTQAQKFINQNCSRRILADQTALLCYLFNKSEEQDTSIANINATLSPIPSQIASLQASTSALSTTVNNLQQNQPGKALRIYDAQDHELGISDGDTPFNTNLNKLIPISDKGLAGEQTTSWYTTTDCSGTAYIQPVNGFDPSMYIYNVAGVHMEVDTTIPVINNLTVHSAFFPGSPPHNGCQLESFPEDNLFTLKLVASQYQEPIPLPLKIKYQ